MTWKSALQYAGVVAAPFTGGASLALTGAAGLLDSGGKGGGASGAAEVQPPGTPTIDDARRNLQASDRLRRRRGVLANIFGGANPSTPTVATKTLLGS